MSPQSLGSGRAEPGDYAAFGAGTVVEPGALVFEPACIDLGADPPGEPVTRAPDRFGAVIVGDACNIGVGSVLLPGITLGAGVQVGAGAVVRGSHPPGAVMAGIPARMLRMREKGDRAAGLTDRP